MGKKLILYFSLFCFCFLCFIKRSDASETMLASLQEQVSKLVSTVSELQTTVQNQNKLIEAQNSKIQYLEQNVEKVAQTQTTSGAQPTTQLITATGKIPAQAGLSQGFNPDIGFVTSIEAKSTQSSEDGEGNDTITLKEAELSIAQYVDPYSRLDGIISFNDNLEEQNVDLEEVYYTHWGLPVGFKGQIGKFRPKIGKANLLHSHQLDTTDYPLVIRDFFGEEGMVNSGARLQNHIPNPWDIPLEVTGEILRGNNGTSFSGISRRPIFNSHIKSYFDLTDNQNVELGWTTLFGDENPADLVFTEEGTDIETVISENGQNKYGVKVFGADATYNWRLPEGKNLKWQNEVYFQNRGSSTRFANKQPWGFYTLLDYRLSRLFSVGTRFDMLRPLSVDGDETFGISPYITFWQSEYADFKLQYSRTKSADDGIEDNHEVFLKANVLIGAHKHPVQ